MALAISNRNIFFTKYTKRFKDSYIPKYNLVDSFKVPRDKVNDLLQDDEVNISILLVGNLINNFNNKFGESYALKAGSSYGDPHGIPFNLQYLVYYNKNNGEVLLKRDVRN